MALSLDVFNVLGFKDVTKVQTMVNYGSNPWGYHLVSIVDDGYFKSPLERVVPRSFRLSARVDF